MMRSLTLPPPPPPFPPGIVKVVPPVATPQLDVDTLLNLATVFGSAAGAAVPLALLPVGVREQLIAPVAWPDVRAVAPRRKAATATVADFVRAGRARVADRYGRPAPLPAVDVEADFWREWARGDGDAPRPLTAACGDGATGSLFGAPESGCPLAASPWNLAVLARAPGSMVAGLTGPDAVVGVSTPVLQIGELFAHSAWQVEASRGIRRDEGE